MQSHCVFKIGNESNVIPLNKPNLIIAPKPYRPSSTTSVAFNDTDSATSSFCNSPSLRNLEERNSLPSAQPNPLTYQSGSDRQMSKPSLFKPQCSRKAANLVVETQYRISPQQNFLNSAGLRKTTGSCYLEQEIEAEQELRNIFSQKSDQQRYSIMGANQNPQVPRIMRTQSHSLHSQIQWVNNTYLNLDPSDNTYNEIQRPQNPHSKDLMFSAKQKQNDNKVKQSIWASEEKQSLSRSLDQLKTEGSPMNDCCDSMTTSTSSKSDLSMTADFFNVKTSSLTEILSQQKCEQSFLSESPTMFQLADSAIENMYETQL